MENLLSISESFILVAVDYHDFYPFEKFLKTFDKNIKTEEITGILEEEDFATVYRMVVYKGERPQNLKELKQIKI